MHRIARAQRGRPRAPRFLRARRRFPRVRRRRCCDDRRPLRRHLVGRRGAHAAPHGLARNNTSNFTLKKKGQTNKLTQTSSSPAPASRARPGATPSAFRFHRRARTARTPHEHPAPVP